MSPDSLSPAPIEVRDDLLFSLRLQALTSVNAARAALDAIAFSTEAPDWRDVESADLLAHAADLLSSGIPP